MPVVNGRYTGPPWPHVTNAGPGAPKRIPGESDESYDKRINAWLDAGAHGAPGGGGGLLPPPVIKVPGVGTITDVAGLISALGNPNTWIRVAEFTVGAILITVGLSKMTGTSSAVGKGLKKVNPYI